MLESLQVKPLQKEAKVMELMYRGARYQVAPSEVKVVNTPVVGRYRGAAVQFHQVAMMPAVQHILHLVYRGVAFDEGVSTLMPEV